MFVAVNHVADRQRLSLLPGDWQVFMTDVPVGQTYADLSATAAVEGWSHEVVVLQDDVRIPGVSYDAWMFDLVVYGQQHEDGWGVCPRAFSATTDVWLWLAQAWKDAPSTLCVDFGAACNLFDTLVLDNAEHLEPVRSKVNGTST